MTHAYIYDAVRTPRGKARADGGLAKSKPQELVAGLVDGLQARGHDARNVQALVLGCVDQVGDQGANIALVSKLHAGVADDAYAFTLEQLLRVRPYGDRPCGNAGRSRQPGPGARGRRRDDVARAVPRRQGELLHGRELPQANALHPGRARGRPAGRSGGCLAQRNSMRFRSRRNSGPAPPKRTRH